MRPLLLALLVVSACAHTAPPPMPTPPLPTPAEIAIEWRFRPIPGQNALDVEYAITNRSKQPIGIRSLDRDDRFVGAAVVRDQEDSAILLGIPGRVTFDGPPAPVWLTMLGVGETLRGKAPARLPNWDHTGFLRDTGLEWLYLRVPIYILDDEGRPRRVGTWRDGPRKLRISDFPEVKRRGFGYPEPWGGVPADWERPDWAGPAE